MNLRLSVVKTLKVRKTSDCINDCDFEHGKTKDMSGGPYIVRICSWNVHTGFYKCDKYEQWLISDKSPHIIAVGFQEFYFKLKDIVAPDINFNSKNNISPLRKWIDYFNTLELIKENYYLYLSKSYGGICLFIYIRKQQRKPNLVSNLLVGSIPIGLFGFANKGALSISFRFEDISICFINCHLPAGAERRVKRQDCFQQIIQHLKLRSSAQTKQKSVKFLESEFDAIFFFGDLNFRLKNISSKEAIRLIKENENEAICEFAKLDELRNTKNQDALYGCFKEGNITFLPTYKFILNTREYDIKRIPSYCDRILWIGNSCVNLTYKRHPEFEFSDHVPISGDYMIDTGKGKNDVGIIKIRKTPRIKVSETTVDFEDVKFLKNKSKEITITNVSLVKADVVIKSLVHGNILPDWLAVLPSAVSLEVKSSVTIEFRIFIDQEKVSDFNYGKQSLNCKLIGISVTNGAEIAITFKGHFIPNVFGLSLPILGLLKKPIQSYQVSELHKLENQCKDKINIANITLLEKILTLLLTNSSFKSFSRLIQHQSSQREHVLQLIDNINALVNLSDNQTLQHSDNNDHQINTATYIETFFIFIKSLPQPLIPFVTQAKLINKPLEKLYIRNVLEQLPIQNYIVLKKMIFYFHNMISTTTDLEIVTDFISSCIQLSKKSITKQMTSVLINLLKKPEVFLKE